MIGRSFYLVWTRIFFCFVGFLANRCGIAQRLGILTDAEQLLGWVGGIVYGTVYIKAWWVCCLVSS
jgi:hypothetical protein